MDGEKRRRRSPDAVVAATVDPGGPVGCACYATKPGSKQQFRTPVSQPSSERCCSQLQFENAMGTDCNFESAILLPVSPGQGKDIRRQLQILRNALGLDANGNGTCLRNRLAIAIAGDDYAQCLDLAGSGLMVRQLGHDLPAGVAVFTVTEIGRAAASAGYVSHVH